jgi:hypothetical protein
MNQITDYADTMRFANGFSDVQTFLDRFDGKYFHDTAPTTEYAKHFALFDLCLNHCRINRALTHH